MGRSGVHETIDFNTYREYVVNQVYEVSTNRRNTEWILRYEMTPSQNQFHRKMES